MSWNSCVGGFRVDFILEIGFLTYKRQKCNNKTIKNLEDNSVCDVCRSPNGEDGNELVFCDGCDICVHQHCYGIPKIDDSDWFCHPCMVNF